MKGKANIPQQNTKYWYLKIAFVTILLYQRVYKKTQQLLEMETKQSNDIKMKPAGLHMWTVNQEQRPPLFLGVVRQDYRIWYTHKKACDESFKWLANLYEELDSTFYHTTIIVGFYA